MTIREIIDEILRREGGFVDHPADRGGPTKYGITLETLQNWMPHRRITRADVEALEEHVARQIYEQEYYRRPGIDRLPAGLRPFMVDAAVNHGPKNAIRMLQQAVNLTLRRPTLTEDGVIGPATIDATEDALAALFVRHALAPQRRSFYFNIIRRDRSQAVFLDGWMNRLDEFA